MRVYEKQTKARHFLEHTGKRKPTHVFHKNRRQKEKNFIVSMHIKINEKKCCTSVFVNARENKYSNGVIADNVLISLSIGIGR
jgi:hypothetical protein